MGCWKWTQTLVAMIALMSSSGCASVGPEDLDVTWDIKSSVNMSGYRNYRWRESANSYARAFEMRGDRAERAEKTLRDAVNRQLAEKGYLQSLTDEPDFLVSYRIAVFEVAAEQPTAAERHRAREGEILATADSPTRDIDREERPELIRRGTLILYVEDAASGKLAWSGTASASATSLKDGRDTAAAAVRRLLERFPN